LTGETHGGDVLLDLGVHHFDLWRALLGADVEDVRACSDGTATAVAARAGGTLLSGIFGAGVAANHTLAVYGDAGTLSVRLDRFDGLELVPRGRLPGDAALRARRTARQLVGLPRALRSLARGGDLPLAFRAQWRAFAAAVRAGDPPDASLEDGHRALAAALAAARELEPAGATDRGPAFPAAPDLTPERAGPPNRVPT
jgi:predicted dehydrogenase